MQASELAPVGPAGILIGCLLLLGSPWGPCALAEDEAPAGEEENPLADVADAEARKLAAALLKVGRKKNANDVLPSLAAIKGLRHEAFEKPLLKLLGHPSSLVAVEAATMWEWRVHPKIASKVWRASWGHPANKRRYAVTTKVLRGFARARIELGKREFDEVERAWRWMVGNPDPLFAPALGDVAAYCGATGDKRLCRWLAESLDEPVATSPNAASNPPAEWWERRWKLWKEAKPAVVAALKALTGQEFDKTAAARAWFEEHEKTFGFSW